jgi:hypothetical protein
MCQSFDYYCTCCHLFFEHIGFGLCPYYKLVLDYKTACDSVINYKVFAKTRLCNTCSASETCKYSVCRKVEIKKNELKVVTKKTDEQKNIKPGDKNTYLMK